MARDTLLGFPSHTLPYRYCKSYQFIDRFTAPGIAGAVFILYLARMLFTTLKEELVEVFTLLTALTL